MKKFIVNSSILPPKLDPIECAVAIPEMLKGADVKNVSVQHCYCCSEDKKVVFTVEAPTKEYLSSSLQKIGFPVDSIMETTATTPKKK